MLERFCRETNTLEGVNRFRKIIEKHERKALGVMEKPNWELTEPGKETIEHLLMSHYPAAEEPTAKIYKTETIDTSDLEHFSKDWINDITITTALNTFHNKKSPGTDKLKPVIFKHLPNNVIKWMYVCMYVCNRLPLPHDH